MVKNVFDREQVRLISFVRSDSSIFIHHLLSELSHSLAAASW